MSLLTSRAWHCKILPLVREWQADLSYSDWEAVRREVNGYTDSDYEVDYVINEQGRLCQPGWKSNNFDLTTYMWTWQPHPSTRPHIDPDIETLDPDFEVLGWVTIPR